MSEDTTVYKILLFESWFRITCYRIEIISEIKVLKG